MYKPVDRRFSQFLMDYHKLGSFMKLTKKQLQCMPKEVLLACAPEEIALIWDKLPKHLKDDKDILQYQFCTNHEEIGGLGDVIDGPPRRKLFCCYCNIKDIQINAGSRKEEEGDSGNNLLNKL